MSNLNKIKVGVIGSAGYTGGELTRLLLNHPNAELGFATSRSFTGQPITDIHTDLIGETDLIFTEMNTDVDVLFLCLPHKQSRPWLQENQIPAHIKIIDLGNDFRVDNTFGSREFVYGLPEFQIDKIRNANLVANPGCFATAIQVALLPLAKAGLLSSVYTTGITGSTGAGKDLQPTTHFTWRNNNISAYKTLSHQHLNEIQSTLKSLNNKDVDVNFVPWRGDFPRGIFTTSVLESKLSLEELNHLYQDFYKDSKFTFISSKNIDLKQVTNTNKALVHIERAGNKIAIHSAIDNLLKGASGQAIHNMNLMFGFDEKAGLNLKPQAF